MQTVASQSRSEAPSLTDEPIIERLAMTIDRLPETSDRRVKSIAYETGSRAVDGGCVMEVPRNGYDRIPFKWTPSFIETSAGYVPTLTVGDNEIQARILVYEDGGWPAGILFQEPIKHGAFEIPVETGKLGYFDFMTNQATSIG